MQLLLKPLKIYNNFLFTNLFFSLSLPLGLFQDYYDYFSGS
ncbi:hypothetical protein CJD_1141 [Clostridium perfringens D str. JGS1721]|uniref:Uncharacterized protein n=2 Tax=Clostridium perfringens TaxID=1502 RepID=A0A133NA94_CLOPF|nr:hypothetical protein CJD_1141 [Clostridium perfringens D str. JGS1721]KXA13224.1 hypothetical protein HMPREF3222_00940 [Clostridium perfringens]